MSLRNLLAASFKNTPDNIAVIDRKQSLTYGELHAKSRHLAASLSIKSVLPGDRIGIYLDKSIEAVIAIFAILNSGAAYVPIDPTLPAKRVAFLVNNCRLKGLISDPKKLDKVRDELTSTISSMADVGHGLVWCGITHLSEPDCIDEVNNADDLAYILYTSGSSGHPKGVMVSDRAALTFVEWAADYAGLHSNDRVSSQAPFHFDLSIFDIFATIKVSAAIILVPPEVSIFPRTLADWIEQQGITVWYSVPSVLIRLVVQGGLERYSYSRLRKILFAGEVFPINLLRELQAAIPHPGYHNLYGPTESNVCSAYEVGIITSTETAPIPIGQACAGNELLVVNEYDEICRPGETGEVLITGPTLMQGYWGMPELTREVFASLPARQNIQFYRSGDYAYQDQTGNLHYCGRRDRQIKIRGYRIEPGEIEAVLMLHPKVLQATVLPVEHRVNDSRDGGFIKAYVVPRIANTFTIQELILFCAENLPSYMVPRAIEVKTYLPTTANGKLDLSRLK